jgi:CPA2 family monovalent cation:H+ antiporter-2
LPMVGTMTIITSFLSPYLVKFGWKIGDRFKEGEGGGEEEEEEPGEQSEKEEQEEQPRKED